jgi:hypothetical protein
MFNSFSFFFFKVNAYMNIPDPSGRHNIGQSLWTQTAKHWSAGLPSFPTVYSKAPIHTIQNDNLKKKNEQTITMTAVCTGFLAKAKASFHSLHFTAWCCADVA